MRKAESRAWTKGFACAAALIMRTHHEDNVCREVVRCSVGDHRGVGIRAIFAEDGVDEFDLKWIDKAFVGQSANVHDEWFGNVKGGDDA